MAEKSGGPHVAAKNEDSGHIERSNRGITSTRNKSMYETFHGESHPQVFKIHSDSDSDGENADSNSTSNSDSNSNSVNETASLYEYESESGTSTEFIFIDDAEDDKQNSSIEYVDSSNSNVNDASINIE